MDKCQNCGSPIFQKTCLNCKNHQDIITGGRKDHYRFQCNFLNQKILQMYYFTPLKAEACKGWAHNCEVKLFADRLDVHVSI